ncbi:MAG: acylphosphatase [Propionibacteriaceae bacterium]|nr:acylphosphatase [Propionibacteriaceae bacterium]
MHRAIITVDGRVQGVGFRWWVMGEARELGLAGHAANLDDGTVRVDVQGDLTKIGAMVRRLIEQPTAAGRPGHVTSHTVRWAEPVPGVSGFRAY